MLNITVAGRITKDSVLRFTAEGTPVLGFTVATDVGWGDSKHPVFVGVSLWGKRAETMDAYLKKGKSVIVCGQGDLRSWKTDQSSGAEITIKADQVEFQTAQPKGAQEPAAGQSGFRNTKPAPVPAPEFADDDIPW
jgi:single-strand DNA-binding protein